MQLSRPPHSNSRKIDPPYYLVILIEESQNQLWKQLYPLKYLKLIDMSFERLGSIIINKKIKYPHTKK
jgi:hypothetical protein